MTHSQQLNDFILSTFSFHTTEHALHQFLHFEYSFLSNNPSLNPRKTNPHSQLLLSSIENYFNFPMILSKRIFSAFDIGHKNFLTQDEYINGFTMLYSGSIPQRIALIFSIFNANNDNVIHIDDVKCILKYSHIYYNKVNADMLEQIILDFFGRHNAFTYEEFVYRICNKDSGLFIIIMALLYENKSVAKEVVMLLEDTEKYGSLSPEGGDGECEGEEVKGNIKDKLMSGKNLRTEGLIVNKKVNGCSNEKCIMGMLEKSQTMEHEQYGNMSHINTNTNANIVSNMNVNNTNNDLILHLPSVESIQYLYNNYGIDMNSLFTDNHSDTNLHNISYTSSHSQLDDPDIETDLSFLTQFDNDYSEIKLRTDFLCKFLNNEHIEYAIPKGSNDFEMKSGLILSKLNSSNSKRSMSSTKSFNIKLINTKKTSRNSNRDLLFASMNKSQNFAKSNSNFNKDSNHFSSNALYALNTKHHDSILQTSLSEFMQHPSSAIESSYNQDSFEEDVLMQMKQNKLKRYTLLLLKTALFIVKKKQFEFQQSKNADYNSLGAKMFIPTKRLYIRGIDYHYVYDNKEYVQVSMVSTLLFKRRSIAVLFEDKHIANCFANVFGRITNYVCMENEYVYIKDIGKGSFSQMKLARHNASGNVYAVKKIKKNVNTVEEFTALNWEKDIITFLKSIPNTSNIIKCYDVIESLDHLYVITEYIAGGSLSSFIRKSNVCLPSSTVKEIVGQIANGVRILHSYGIVHRDLKLENVLMDYKDMQTFTAKVIDFGLSQVITPLSKTNETYGTLIYCSPEILLNAPYNYKVDVWSMGVIAFYLEYTFMPFGIRGKEAEHEISNKIIMSELKFPRKVDSRNEQFEMKANKLMMTIIKKCLAKDINQRVTSMQMHSMLNEH